MIALNRQDWGYLFPVYHKNHLAYAWLQYIFAHFQSHLHTPLVPKVYPKGQLIRHKPLFRPMFSLSPDQAKWFVPYLAVHCKGSKTVAKLCEWFCRNYGFFPPPAEYAKCAQTYIAVGNFQMLSVE